MSAQSPVQVAVRSEGGKVILKFDSDINYLEMEPENCLLITEAMATAAFEARDGMKPVGPALKAEIVERHRMTLTQRVALMLNTLRDDRTKSNGQVARDIVDVMLAEVF